MKNCVTQVRTTSLEYFIRGENPKLLITSGIHGDEYGVIDSVREAVEKYEGSLGDFIYVPVASPSAVASKKRKNKNGYDVNRSFFDEVQDDEVQTLRTIIDPYHFDLTVSFHEDTEFSEFYLYDSLDRKDSDEWKSLRQKIRQLGVPLLTGVDDPNDPVLHFLFTEGYCSTPHDFTKPLDGTLENWMMRKKKTESWIMPEIPSRLEKKMKTKIVDLIFSDFILNVY